MSGKKTKLAVYSLLTFAAFLLIFIRVPLFIPLEFNVVHWVSGPVRVLSLPFKEFKKILFYHWTFNEYIRLRHQVNNFTARIVGMDEVMRENLRLEKLLEFKRKQIFSSVAARVIGRDPTNWNASIIIDRGNEDGIETGMPVVSASGVVGKIAEVGKNKAKIILVTDPSFSVAALAQRSREVGLVSGTLQGLCRMRYLPAGADLQVGDIVMTSKLSSSFPEGLLIGEIVSVKYRAHDEMVEGVIQPLVPLSQVEEVLVILKNVK